MPRSYSRNQFLDYNNSDARIDYGQQPDWKIREIVREAKGLFTVNHYRAISQRERITIRQVTELAPLRSRVKRLGI